MKKVEVWAAWGFFVIAAFGNYIDKDYGGAIECTGLALLASFLISQSE